MSTSLPPSMDVLEQHIEPTNTQYVLHQRSSFSAPHLVLKSQTLVLRATTICTDNPIENEKGAYTSLSESAQLQAWVAEKVEDILSKCDGEFDGAVCEWLKEELTFKYNELIADAPLRAAAFLGTMLEGLSVKYLKYLRQVEICEK
ncbi:hypothetical protein BJ741DRAFT_714735 [Chytriomyces cf. hyalinus JEL632]|nr:hypothetical protein BJ741DRAFT_714735 [Chytriomyces cf. hyalinus JEL632]